MLLLERLAEEFLFCEPVLLDTDDEALLRVCGAELLPTDAEDELREEAELLGAETLELLDEDIDEDEDDLDDDDDEVPVDPPERLDWARASFGTAVKAIARKQVIVNLIMFLIKRTF